MASAEVFITITSPKKIMILPACVSLSVTF